ncbi:WD40 repeat-like protein [Cylindrobasidium torrendii FP15055 ss-10]|uniref:WD40 repeat-like protein n=1 Tax=Cylindrobasidium torrendii FP15055 ss-10 TaxID=1314674 RepID=A0A0D7B5L1_9AGAR|nr:WD40 repeat-like protein [Cylindrobasidium torrendii FP15055 ss-10]
MSPSSPIPSFPSLLDSPVIRKGNTVSDTSNAVLSLGRSPPLRSIPKVPFRVLDAPGMVANFYFDLIDWSAAGMVAVGLDTSVYLWKAYDGPPVVLCDLKPDIVSSVRWSQQSATTLAVGTSSGTFYIYDTIELKALRSFTSAHTTSIGALAWSGPTIATGSRDHYFRQWDLRERTSEPFRQRTHGKEVCGLKWSLEENSTMLASGGDDNKVCIWDFRGSEPAKPKRQEGLVYTFDEHKAAVKALAWDPHVSGRLASGGGNGDQYIRFWDVRTGENVDSVHTGSQILNLAWSVNSHELVSTHGFASKIPAAQNQVCVWSCPDLTMLASLSGHTDRVLYLAMGPTGETIVTASGDQSVRFWNIFPSKPPPLRKAGPSGLLDSIR